MTYGSVPVDKQTTGVHLAKKATVISMKKLVMFVYGNALIAKLSMLGIAITVLIAKAGMRHHVVDKWYKS